MKKTLVIVGGVVAVLAVVAGVGLWWFFKDDAPAKVNLADAVASVTTTTAAPGASTTASTAASTAEGIAGTWTVDDSSGTFDYDTATGTFAGFRIAENLSGIGSTTAVGRTGDVTGTVTIEGTTLAPPPSRST